MLKREAFRRAGLACQHNSIISVPALHNIEFRNSVSPVSFAVIEALEATLRSPLPEDYKDFLINVNGGDPSVGCFKCAEVDDEMWVDWFFGAEARELKESNNTYSTYGLECAIETFKDIIPEETIPIGMVCRDDPLLLFIDGPKRGHVYVKVLFDLPTASRDDWQASRGEAIYFASRSFNKFLQLLHAE